LNVQPGHTHAISNSHRAAGVTAPDLEHALATLPALWVDQMLAEPAPQAATQHLSVGKLHIVVTAIDARYDAFYFHYGLLDLLPDTF